MTTAAPTAASATTLVAFAGTRLLVRGTPEQVLRSAKARHERGERKRLAIYDEASGRAVDVDLSGSLAEVEARLARHPLLAGGEAEEPTRARGPGRPRLGVISREVSLLPRHWAWLADQPGGASATLRSLVERARKQSGAEDATRRAIEAAYRFMSDLAGDLPGFEEASRALFARRFDDFVRAVAAWPAGVRGQLMRYVRLASPT